MIERRPFEQLGGAGQPGQSGSAAWSSRPFPKTDRSARLVTLASGDPADAGALPIRANARVLGSSLRAGDAVSYSMEAGRRGYLVPPVGTIEINGVSIGTRDGAAIRDATMLKITATEDTEFLLVDVVGTD